jgi:hypothetical protein
LKELLRVVESRKDIGIGIADRLGSNILGARLKAGSGALCLGCGLMSAFGEALEGFAGLLDRLLG